MLGHLPTFTQLTTLLIPQGVTFNQEEPEPYLKMSRSMVGS